MTFKRPQRECHKSNGMRHPILGYRIVLIARRRIFAKPHPYARDVSFFGVEERQVVCCTIEIAVPRIPRFVGRWVRAPLHGLSVVHKVALKLELKSEVASGLGNKGQENSETAFPVLLNDCQI